MTVGNNVRNGDGRRGHIMVCEGMKKVSETLGGILGTP